MYTTPVRVGFPRRQSHGDGRVEKLGTSIAFPVERAVSVSDMTFLEPYFKNKSRMKNNPIVAANKPIKVELEKDKTYYWCRCGRSQNQPFCDGSHAGTGFTPVEFKAKKDGATWLCACKQTHDQPYCDGHHAMVSDDKVGTPFSLDGFNTADVPEGGKTDTNTTLASSEKKDSQETSDAHNGMPRAVPTPEEPTVAYIHDLAHNGLKNMGPYGEMVAMGVPRSKLPDWNDIQIMAAQFATQPLQEDDPVGTALIIGPEAKKPLELRIPLFVSDMSYGALSPEAKTALAKGAELAGTGIASGEGGMFPPEQANNSRYLFEYASAGFGYSEALLSKVQAFHFKGGQAAKTGTGGHLPGNKVSKEIAEIRGIPEGEDANSPATFRNLHTVEDFQRFGDRVRELTGGVPIGFKMSAQHIEKDIAFAVQAGADYIILDGRGGGTGDAPAIFRDHISVPTIPALTRARRTLDALGASGRVTLIITGGIRTPVDFVKALALGADGIALANSAIQAVGCVGARICNTNLCPSGIATQDPRLRARLNVDEAAQRLERFFNASTQLMQLLARACGHDHFNKFNPDDLSAWKKGMAELAGIRWSGAGYLDD